MTTSIKRPPRYNRHFFLDKTDLQYISMAAFILIRPPRYSGITTSCLGQNYDISVQIYLVIATTKSYKLGTNKPRTIYNTYKTKNALLWGQGQLWYWEQHVNEAI